MTSTACLLKHHSPTFNGKVWSCPDCDADVKPSPLARLHAALDRTTADEWLVFTTALKQAVGPGGFISQTRVRPLIQAIPPRHREALFRRATSAGLIKAIGFEPSTTDGAPQKTYHWQGEAA
ncbi:hypothetical protein [Nocardioides aromaticivorans]|uniref:hypothetical protein n=1 Tax=Nocardioides aromaticivorans TaxID=200618 RepID=UPI001A8F90A6|nr:hypothetical protein [Nocardioides aromaticivorans]